VLEDDLKAVVKPQYVDQIPKAIKGPDKTVGHLISGRAQMENFDEIIDVLGMQRHKRVVCLR
jgi:ATP-binding cassette subfamily E protein 1